jgi:hypothetical protein
VLFELNEIWWGSSLPICLKKLQIHEKHIKIQFSQPSTSGPSSLTMNLLHQSHGSSSRSTKLVEHQTQVWWSWKKLLTMPLITQKQMVHYFFLSSSYRF